MCTTTSRLANMRVGAPTNNVQLIGNLYRAPFVAPCGVLRTYVAAR